MLSQSQPSNRSSFNSLSYHKKAPQLGGATERYNIRRSAREELSILWETKLAVDPLRVDSRFARVPAQGHIELAARSANPQSSCLLFGEAQGFDLGGELEPRRKRGGVELFSR